MVPRGTIACAYAIVLDITITPHYRSRMGTPRFVDDTVPTPEAIRLHRMVRRDGIPLMDVAREFEVKPPRAHQILTMMDEVAQALKVNSSLPGAQGEHGQ